MAQGVSIHARTGRATVHDRLTVGVNPFQFTRARGARLREVGFFGVRAFVSIHARTGRATLVAHRQVLPVRVSIHARTGRATPSFPSFQGGAGFQFTRARGARPSISRVVLWTRPFQFTRARGARRFLRLRFPPRSSMFQFTRARGARRSAGSGGKRRCRFNSRAHGARDPCGVAPLPNR